MKFKDFLTKKGYTEDTFKALDAEKQAQIHGEFLGELSASIEGKASSADVDAIKAQIESLKVSSDLTTIKAAHDKLELEIAALKEGQHDSKTDKNLTVEQAIAKALNDSKDSIEKFANGDEKKITIKTPVTIGTNNTIDAQGSASHYLLTAFTGIYSMLRKRILTYLTNVSVGTISAPHAMWVEELDEKGNPIFLGEGGAKPQVSVRYEEREMKSRKIAAWVKVTKEMLRDLPQLISYVQANLVKRIDLATETALFVADGLGNNVKGLTEYAQAFTGGGLTTTDPTFADVFRALALQVELANGTASAVFVKPSILAQMDVEKDSEGRYIIPPFRSPSTGNQVAGITLISTNALGASDPDFIGGDLSVVQVRFREGMSIEMDRTGDDFTNNLYTILAEQELVQFVSANDVQVLVKGTMATAVDAITTPTT
jgi:HK97 family phage major capsid protein